MLMGMKVCILLENSLLGIANYLENRQKKKLKVL